MFYLVKLEKLDILERLETLECLALKYAFLVLSLKLLHASNESLTAFD